jgi:AcrR family transcriptional regulator
MSNEIPHRGEHTRVEILQSAHDLFITQGYHGTSIRQIAQQAGLAIGSLYNHFASKEDVFLAVLWEFHPYHAVLPAILAAQGEPIEQFTRYVLDRMVAAVSESPGFMNLMFIEVVEFKGAHLNQLFSSLHPQWRQVAQVLLEAEGGRLKPIPPLMFMRIFLGTFFAYYLTEVLFAPVAPLEFRQSAIDHFVDVFLHGVIAEHPGRPAAA